jgi:hypothetical protein
VIDKESNTSTGSQITYCKRYSRSSLRTECDVMRSNNRVVSLICSMEIAMYTLQFVFVHFLASFVHLLFLILRDHLILINGLDTLDTLLFTSPLALRCAFA